MVTKNRTVRSVLGRARIPRPKVVYRPKPKPKPNGIKIPPHYPIPHPPKYPPSWRHRPVPLKAKTRPVLVYKPKPIGKAPLKPRIQRPVSFKAFYGFDKPTVKYTGRPRITKGISPTWKPRTYTPPIVDPTVSRQITRKEKKVKK